MFEKLRASLYNTFSITPGSRDYTLRPRGFLGVRFGKSHGTVNNGCQRCQKVSYFARNWPRYIHDVSIVIKQIKSQHFFAHRQKCRDISSMATADRCEPGIKCSPEKNVNFLDDINNKTKRLKALQVLITKWGHYVTF